MCGIAGAFVPGAGAQAPPAAADSVAGMAARLAHRGPDGEGLVVRDAGVLAHRRLAIHDLGPAGLQPMVSEDGAIAIAVNGTIHNAPDLAARERLLGHAFRSRSDSEVLIPLWRRLGPALLPLLRGPFAFAIHDRRRGELFLARDRLGKKPLFHARIGDTILFASELGALASALPSRALDRDALGAWFQAGWVAAPRTLLAGVQSLPPGHSLLVSADGAKVEPWWRPDSAEDAALDEESSARLVSEVLKEAVFLRTRTERPLGTLLSGGLDSAAILALATGVLQRGVPSFTLGFDDPRLDERAEAAATASALGSPHRESVFDRDPGPVLEDLVATTGEPLADPSWLAMALVCERASSEATVLLSGDGGDELLLGYRRHAAARLAGRIRSPLARSLLAAVAPLLPGSRLRKAAGALARGPAPALADLVSLLPAARRREVLAGGTPREDALVRLYSTFGAPAGGGGAADGGGTAALWDLLTYLPGDLLPKADRASMRHGVEIWSPFLDPVVVDTLLRIPARIRLRLGRSKAPLRRLLAGRIPAAALRRRKRGFGVPLGRWLRSGSYGRFAEEILGDVREPFQGFLPGDSALPLLRRLREGEEDLAPLVHACVVLALWTSRLAVAGGAACA